MVRNLRLAVADDEEEVRQYFAATLSRCGYDVVVSASSGRELVDQCRAARPDLVITDIRMDGISGVDAIAELAKDGPIPTIFVSAHYQASDLPDEIGTDLAGSVIAFLSKPVKMSALKAAVAEAASRIDN